MLVLSTGSAGPQVSFTARSHQNPLVVTDCTPWQGSLPAQEVVIAVGEGPARLHKRQLLVALKVPDGLEQPVCWHLLESNTCQPSALIILQATSLATFCVCHTRMETLRMFESGTPFMPSHLRLQWKCDCS